LFEVAGFVRKSYVNSSADLPGQKKNDWIFWHILLLVIAFLAMLQLILLNHPLKYDAIDQAYPWKYFIGQCLQNGYLPLWNPYQLLGSPIHADPQSSAWYPVTWFFGYFFGYTIYTLSFDFFLHIFLAGAGMFYLGRQLKFRNEAAFMMGASYMLCGFFIGNAQHFMWIISGTWVPFVIGAFIGLHENRTIRDVLKLSLVLFMFTTGGYPAFIFLTGYLLVFLFLFYIVLMIAEKKQNEIVRYAGLNALSLFLAALMSTVMIVSIYFLRDEMTRGSGVTLTQALFGPFSPRSFISFILPFAAVRDMEFYGTDLSMSNGYFGLLTLVFFLVALLVKRTKLVNLFLAWGILMLAAAMGRVLPVREFLYDHIPFMNLFRFPALFRLFAIISFIVVAGYAIDSFIKNKGLPVQYLRVAAIFTGIVLLGFVLFAISKKSLNLAGFIKEDLFIFSERSTVSQHIFFQGIIQLFLLLIFILSLYLMKTRSGLVRLMIMVLSADLIFATSLNGPYTLYSHLYRSRDVKAHADAFPKGFPLPGMNPVIKNKDQGNLVYQTLWRNQNIFHKQVSFEGYNPLHLKGFEELADNHPRMFETILQNPLIYLSSVVYPSDSISLHESLGKYDRRNIYLDPVNYDSARFRVGNSNPGDTVLIISFSPDQVTARYQSREPQVITLLQNNYPGWKVLIDGKESKVMTSGLSFISAIVPAGDHTVTFRFRPTAVITGFYISAISFITALIVLIILSFRQMNKIKGKMDL
jgi:hypothetical protein